MATGRGDERWRPDDPSGPVCGYRLRDEVCTKSGAHFCLPRSSKPVLFAAEFLQHVKGVRARTPLVFTDWQEWDVIRPIFGEVRFDSELGIYVRRYRVAYIVVSRKNGKSMLASALLLFALLADDEQSAEVYTAAANTKQAGVIFDPCRRMVRIVVRRAGRRLPHHPRVDRIRVNVLSV